MGCKEGMGNGGGGCWMGEGLDVVMSVNFLCGFRIQVG